MTDPSTADVLLALRLRGVVDSSVLAERVRAPEASLAAVLESCVRAGWVQRSHGRLSGWSLTAAGRRHGEQLLADELVAAGVRAPMEAAYQGFLPLNAELLSVCTAWQVVVIDGAEAPNDHLDPVRDAAVLARLSALHASTEPLLAELAGLTARFGGYQHRLDAAHARVAAGSHEWIARPTIDSYHTVWFELHEHLLATLGRTRTDERTPEPAPAPHEEYA
jgi:hypothetical protein